MICRACLSGVDRWIWLLRPKLFSLDPSVPHLQMTIALRGRTHIRTFRYCAKQPSMSSRSSEESESSSAVNRSLFSRKMRTALTPRTIMRHLMTENIAINAEVIPASLALIPARLTRTFRSLRPRTSLVVLVTVRHVLWGRNRREAGQAAIALRTPLLPRTNPGDFNPIP